MSALALAALAALSAVARAEPDAAAARTVAAEATMAREAHEDASAAALFEEAHEADPHPLWQVAAGEAWLDAAEPERAADRLRGALADPRLPEASRARVAELARVAEGLAPIVARARAATLAQRHAAAAGAWAEAFARRPTGRHRLEEARALARAKRTGEAERALRDAAGRADLSRAERVEVGEALARIEARKQPVVPAASRSSAPLWLVVSGGALVVGGVVALAIAESRRADVRAAMDEDPETRTMTRAEALALRDDADTLDVVGLVGGGLGLALAGTGLALGTAGGLGFNF